jgi:membrane-bound lytic murein transglycosylase D
LKYLPVIESALNPTAVSRMGAKGLWQFIISTSRAYGLVSNNYVEERYDPIKSTRAALEYLKDLYEMFGNWELALASYNCGPGNVNKAIKRSGGKTDFWEIYPYLPQETRGYVPGFIAANYIMTFYEDHGICPMEPNLSVATDTVHVSKNLHFRQIVNVCGADINELRAMNPQYIRDIVPGENGTYTLRLTNDMLDKFIENEDSIYNHKVDEFFPDKNIDKMLKEAKLNNGNDSKGSKSGKGKGNKGRLVHHKIKSGESLGSIARKHRVTVKQIMKWNNLRNTKIRAGRTLKIYK